MSKYITCVLCGEELHNRNFSAHRNDNLHKDLGFCKKCLLEKVDMKSEESVLHMLRMMNIPFIKSVWDNTLEEDPDMIFTKYLQVASFQRGKYKNFIDGDLTKKSNSNSKDDGSNPKPKEMMAKWGQVDDPERYDLYESVYESLTEIKRPNGRFEEDRYAQCVKIKVALDSAITGGDSNDIKRLQETYQKQLSALGLNITKNEEEEKTIGERIKFYEENHPIPQPDPDLQDVDKVNNYIVRNFLYPVKRMFGQATEEEIQQIYEQD